MGCPPQPPLKWKPYENWPPPTARPRAEARGGCPPPPSHPLEGGRRAGPEIPEKEGRERERERERKRISSGPQWSSVAIPALAVARNELAAVARLKIPVALRPPFSVWGYWAISGCPPCAADVDFIKSAQAEFQPPSYDGATCCTCRGRLGSSLLGLVFGVVLGVC